MEYPKFRRGDKVKANGSTGEVLGFYRDDTNTIKYKIKYDYLHHSKDVTEDEMTFFHEDLSEIVMKKVGNLGDKCPRCNTPWTVTGFGATQWKDCVTCKRKAEDIVGKSEPDNDLLDEFEKMLGDGDFDWTGFI